MKKTIALLTTVCLFVTPLTVSAEEFTLRNDIRFGESTEEVRAKESFRLDGIDRQDSKAIFTYEDETVSGIENTDVMYLFEDDELYEMYYSFEFTDREDIMTRNYETLHDGLVRKYGEPLSHSNGEAFVITTDAFAEAVSAYNMIKEIGGVGDYVDYDEWIIEADDYNVKIDIIEFYIGKSSLDTLYGIVLGYHKFTEDQIEEQIEENQNIEQERQSIVDSDL